jgi:hypothetical protein
LFKKDPAQAKAFLVRAREAGRNDTRLASNIDKFEKGLQAQEQAEKEFREAVEQKPDEPDAATLGGQLMRGSSASKRSAARRLRQFGRPAVEFLAFAAVNDGDMSVREEAINSLGALGGVARDQCRQLQAIARSNPYDSTVMDKKQMEMMVQYEDLRRAAKDAIAKIGCGG